MTLLPAPIRYAVRSLRRTPAFSIAAALTLSLGIGATTTIFTVVNGVLLRPLPYAHPDRLVGLWFGFSGLGIPQAGFSDGTYFLFGRQQRSFEQLAAYQDDAVNLNLPGTSEPERVTAAQTTASLASVLQVSPVQGRFYTESEDRPNQARVVVIGEAMWRRKFGADPALVGRTIQLDGVSHQVIGIMPAWFHFPNERVQLWRPLALDPEHVQVAGFNYNTIARIKAGVTHERAASELQGLLMRLPETYPEVAPGVATRDMLEKGKPRMLVHALRDDVVGDIGRVLWVILGTIGFVLLVACANVANLFLVRADSRQRELAVRSALGAGRAEALRRFLTEGLVLAIAGGAVGLALAAAGLRLLVRLGSRDIPRITEIGIDATTLAVTTVVTLAVALICSALPALRFAGRDLTPLLREGGRSATGGRERQRARQLLVVSQVALALMLLTASGLMARSFWQLRAVRPGFDPAHTLSFRLALPDATYDSRERIVAFYQSALDRLAALPGVRAVGATSKIPLTNEGDNHSALWVEGYQQEPGALPPVLLEMNISDGYLAAAGIPLIAGRTFSRADPSRPSTEALVSQSVARHYFGDASGRAALGGRVRRSPGDDWYTVVGVVGDVRMASLDKPAEEAAYFPMLGYRGQWEFVSPVMSVVIRTTGEPMTLAQPAQQAVHALDPALPIYNLRSLEDVVRISMARTAFTMLLLGIAAGVAILLGVVGIYGVVSYAVSLRTREIGVRIALGARPAQVGSMVARQGLVLAAVGVVTGLAGAVALTRFLQALLFGVSPTDPITLGVSSSLLLGSALLASWLPARRAARVDPVTALRAD